MQKYTGIDAVIEAGRDRAPDTMMRWRTTFECEFFARSRFNAIVKYGRSQGLTVEVVSAGWITRRGMLIAEGRWDRMQPFLRLMQAMES